MDSCDVQRANGISQPVLRASWLCARNCLLQMERARDGVTPVCWYSICGFTITLRDSVSSEMMCGFQMLLQKIILRPA